MLTTPELRDLLSQHGTLEPQAASDWRGDIPLPAVLEAFYREVGPKGNFINDRVGFSGITFPSPGNAFWIPPLSRLWAMQAGYRWHGNTGERLSDWDGRWLVVADQGGDPFILHLDTLEVLHAQHGAGVWEPDTIFPDLWTMTAALATIGNATDAVEDDVWTDDGSLEPRYRTELETRLTPILGTRAQAVSVLETLGF
jgi:hypothetical protein